MNKEEYLQFHKECCNKMYMITTKKNADYTGINPNAFANFSDTIIYAGVSPEQGFLVRMGDKMQRIKSFVDKGILEVKDESVEDTLIDLANYCILMAGYIKSKKE
jgi:hypothetical protein